MTDSELPAKIVQLQQSIANLESLSPSPAIETALQSLRGELAALQAQLGQGVITQASQLTTGERGVPGSSAGRDIITGDNNRQITTIINLYRQGQPAEQNEATLRRQIADYLRGLVNRYSRLELRGIKREGEQVIQLELDQVYVPLAAKTRGQGTAIKLDRVLQQGRHVVITGGPGCGKTTVLLHLASTLALALGSDNPALAAERVGLSLPKKKKEDQEETGLPLPVFIPLSSYARYRRRLPPGSLAADYTLAAFISSYLIRRQQGSFDLPPDFFQQLLRTGRQVMVLLDGLDEVPDENERVEVREAIEGLLDGRPDLQLVVTCRTAAYGGRAVLGRDFREVVVLPLAEEHIARLVRQAYAVPGLFGDDPAAAGLKAEELLQAIANLEAQRRRIYGQETERLITSPLLVRMLIIVHVSDRRLPDQRAELYKKATDNLLLPEFHPDQEVANEIGGLVGGSQSIHRELAQHLAFEMHQRGAKQGRELEEFELRTILKKHPTYPHLAAAFINLARSRNTLLEERGGQYRFIHLAFQEFLAASYLADVRGGEGGYNAIAAFLESGPLLDSWWREPILLIAGYYSIDKPTAAQKFLRRLARLDGPAAILLSGVALAAAELAGAAALEWPAIPAALQQELAGPLAGFFTSPARLDETRPTLRAAAGDTLARLGDPRLGVVGVDDMQFCCVPPGSFLRGSPDEDDLAYDNEKPLRKVNLRYGYWLGRYPVTVAQFRAFVEASGYKPKDKDSLAGLPTHPVTSVTWHEALEFCRWLTRRWRGKLPPGWQVTLPSEMEWEKAARGGLEIPVQPMIATVGGMGQLLQPALQPNSHPRRRYPWGDDADPNRANYGASGIGTTSAVGCFPQGASVYGVEELSGNVWEWCRTKWQENYENYRDDNDLKRNSPRVLRGGAFGSSGRVVRCAARNYVDPPNYWDRHFSFRVCVVGVPPSSSL
ncbi:MAG: SUMF1/EgtB/PvdO family nonheme iron enzyme [Anaerolineae bacterium]|nr:SUMF1/EgtB/PvdO family nonheme iron enzyme [Anaerolineae bacterium]